MAVRRVNDAGGCAELHAGGWLSRFAAERYKKKWVGHPEFEPQNRKPDKIHRQKRAGYAIRMPGRERAPDMRGIAPHAAELAFYFRGCETPSTSPAADEQSDEGATAAMAGMPLFAHVGREKIANLPKAMFPPLVSRRSAIYLELGTTDQ